MSDTASSSIDWRRGLALFSGDRALYMRCLRFFLEDDSLGELEKALSRGDLDAAYLHAHALKGLAAQLCLDCVSAPSSALCRLLLDGGSPAAARAMLPNLRSGCRAARSAIQRLSRENLL